MILGLNHIDRKFIEHHRRIASWFDAAVTISVKPVDGLLEHLSCISYIGL